MKTVSSCGKCILALPVHCAVFHCRKPYCTKLFLNRNALYWTVLHCNVLYCIACSALYCTVLPCIALQCSAVYCTLLHCTVSTCTTLYCAALACMTLQWTKLYCNIAVYTLQGHSCSCSARATYTQYRTPLHSTGEFLLEAGRCSGESLASFQAWEAWEAWYRVGQQEEETFSSLAVQSEFTVQGFQVLSEPCILSILIIIYLRCPWPLVPYPYRNLGYQVH